VTFFIELIQKYVNALFEDPGFGFIGLMKTPFRKIFSISPSLLEKLPCIARTQRVEETLELMEDVSF
jgi:hypothetical protein